MSQPARAAMLFILAVVALLAWAPPAPAAPQAPPSVPVSRVEVLVGHSRVLDLPAAVKRVSVGKEDIADVVVINPRQVYLNGREVGSTNLSLWDRGDRLLAVYEVRVARDLSRLKEQLYQILPQEPVEVRELEGTVVLSGRVSSLQAKEQAEALAHALVPRKDLSESLTKSKDVPWVTSVLEVGSDQQVNIKVRIAEVNRDVTQRFNINTGIFNPLTGDFIFTLLGQVITPYETSIGSGYWPERAGYSTLPLNNPTYHDFGTKYNFSNNMSGMGGFKIGDTRVTGFLDILKQNGLAKILAEPNLTAISGQDAEFLAGGEFPVPVQQKDSVTIMFKKFGVQLNFKPEVLRDGRVRLTVSPEVSELDFTSAVRVAGFVVPSLTSRKAKTQLELKDGQSFAMAGLFRDDIVQAVSKFPVLGDIPILGALFRSTAFQSKKTELVIVVTPEIVRPGMGAPGRLPTDGISAPGDFDLLLMGKFAGQDQAAAALPRSAQEMEGSFGHDPIF